MYYLGFNTQKPPFDQPLVRKAFAQAVDRSLLTQLLQSGQRPQASLITPDLGGYDPTLGLSFNPTAAKALLAQAGYPNGEGFPPVKLMFRTGFQQRREAEVLQFLWKQTLNVDVELASQDWKVYLDHLANHTPHLYKLSWYVDYPDADSLMSLFTADNGNNFTHWAHPHYDRWVREAVTYLERGPATTPVYASPALAARRRGGGYSVVHGG